MTQIDPPMLGRIVAAIHNGIHAHIAAGLAGVPHHVFIQWMRRGQQQRHGSYRDFYLQIEKARAEVRGMVEKEIRHDHPRDWLLHGPGKEDWAAKAQPDPAKQSMLANLVFNRLLSKLLKLLEPFPEARLVVAQAYSRKSRGSLARRTKPLNIKEPRHDEAKEPTVAALATASAAVGGGQCPMGGVPDLPPAAGGGDEAARAGLDLRLPGAEAHQPGGDQSAPLGQRDG